MATYYRLVEGLDSLCAGSSRRQFLDFGERFERFHFDCGVRFPYLPEPFSYREAVISQEQMVELFSALHPWLVRGDIPEEVQPFVRELLGTLCHGQKFHTSFLVVLCD